MALLTTFLTDGGQDDLTVGRQLAGHLAAARQSLDIAIYDLKLDGPVASIVRDAVLDARSRGVAIRLAFNQEGRRAKPLPPPGFMDFDFLHSLAVPSRAIPGEPDLMHHKYVVRDAGTARASVWTGSTNWTHDSWTREENVIVELESPAIAAAYRADFEELWEARAVQRSGHEQPAWTELEPGLRVRAFFAPARAPKLVHEVAQRIATATRRLRVCSPVITSGPVLASVAEAIGRPGLDVLGCYDGTQMAQVEAQWAESPHSGWKRQLWRTVASSLPWGAKVSTPYSPGTVHDFMHAKCVVADDTVFTGSYNLSHSGEKNAENVLEIESPEVADRFAAYVEMVARRYGAPA